MKLILGSGRGFVGHVRLSVGKHRALEWMSRTQGESRRLMGFEVMSMRVKWRSL